MRSIALSAALVALGLGMSPVAAFAQANTSEQVVTQVEAAPEVVTQEQVVAACTVVGNAQCKQLIADYVAKFPAGSDLLQEAIADLVVALATSPAASGSVELKAVVADAIKEVAAKSPDSTQAEQIVAVANTVAKEGTVQTADTVIVNRPSSPA